MVFDQWAISRNTKTLSNSIRWGAISITGDFREHNEDNYLADSDGWYFIVSDGMGGQAAGEKASEMAVQLVSRKLNELIDFNRSLPEQVTSGIDQAVGHANAEIMMTGQVARLQSRHHHPCGTMRLDERLPNYATREDAVMGYQPRKPR